MPNRSGRVLNLDTREDAQNTLMLVVVGEAGLLYVNGELVRDLDVREGAASGSVGIGSGFFDGGQAAGGSRRTTRTFACGRWTGLIPREGKEGKKEKRPGVSGALRSCLYRGAD